MLLLLLLEALVFGICRWSRSVARGQYVSNDRRIHASIDAAVNDIAELYAAAAPESEFDKALVAGYWFQFVDGRPEFGSQEINSALKNLGHPIKNITSAFDSLKSRKPASVMQVKKSGSSRQARKNLQADRRRQERRRDDDRAAALMMGAGNAKGRVTMQQGQAHVGCGSMLRWAQTTRPTLAD